MKKIQFFILSIISCLLLVFSMQNRSGIMTETLAATDTEGNTYLPVNIDVSVDGKSVDLSEAPAIYYQGVLMVPAKELLEQHLGVAYTYNEEAGTIHLEKNSNVVEMQLNSKTAIVSGSAVEMEQGPFAGSQEESGTVKVFVPAEFVAEYLGFGYVEQKITEDNVSVNFITPLEITLDGKKEFYAGNRIKKVVFNGSSYSLADSMVGIEINGTMMLPVQQVIEESAIDGKVLVDQEQIIVKRGYIITFYKEGTTAVVSGTEKKMTEPVHEVIYDGEMYYMVPAEFLFKNLGMTSYSMDTVAEKITVKKSKGIGLNLYTKPEGKSGNYMKKALSQNKTKKDLLTFTFAKTPSVSVISTKTKIKLTLKNVNINQQYDEKVYDAKYTKKVSIKKSGKKVIVTITKKSGTPFLYKYGGGKVYVHVGASPIRIAVDCGHGANTPGKRSPKMPCNIDFDGDGVIDVKKGQSIREHQGNVGVGKYLAKELERCGFKVYRSAFGSTDVSLSGRQRFIKKNKCKYSISVHFNAAGSGTRFNSAQGVEVYYHRNKRNAKNSKKLAQRVVKEMAKGTKQVNRGAKSQVLALCNTRAMGTSASILVECAFMTNLHEAKTMFGNAKYWKETAQEIAKAMCDYTGVTYIKE